MASPSEAAPVSSAPRVEVSPEIVPDNVKAAGILYAAYQFEQMGLFRVADAIADQFMKGMLPIGSTPSRDRLRGYYEARDKRLDGAARQAVIRRVLDGGGGDDNPQLEAYSKLVQAVASSLEAFTKDNVTPSSERDRLADDTGKAGVELALTMSRRMDAPTRDAAGKIDAQTRDALAVLSLPEVLSASQVKTPWELLAKRSNKPLAEIQRLERRGSAGSRLLATLADNSVLLSPARRRDLARKVVSSRSAADQWRVTGTSPSK